MTFSTITLIVAAGLICYSAMGMEQTVKVRMRDGVSISTYISTPSGNGPWPAVLKKGYNIRKSSVGTLNQAGYAYVAQGVRSGTDPHGISGDARFFADDVDGYDTIQWIAQQPWCNGKVAMHGESYFGATQWIAAANGDPGPPPALKAIVPSVINPDFWERTYRAHGAMNLSMTALSRAFQPNQASYENYMYLPLIDMDKAVRGGENTLWNEYVTHWHYQSPGLNGKPYWQHIGMRDKVQRIKIPVYIYAGWWDYYTGASLKYYNLLKDMGHTPEIRVTIGNSGHAQMSMGETIRWWDWVLKGKDNGIKDQPPVRIFVQGINKDQFYDQWPPAGTQYVKYYFHSLDGSRRGTLDTQPPGSESPIQYKYDPRDPVPSIGGNANHRGLNKTLSNGAVLRAGSLDQRPVESRPDVLIFSTPTLTQDVEVIGPVEVKLFAKTDVRDTDFTAVLIDVQPDGSAMNVTEGIIRARFRESIWQAPKLLTPGQIYAYTLELLPTARVFQKGHKIRVHLSSSRFPLWDRNTNTGNDPATDAKTVVATQTIYHDKDRPSHILLPILSPQGTPGEPAKRLDVSAPRSGDEWLTGAMQDIVWTSQGTIANVKIELSRDGGTSWETLVESTANDGSISWTVSGAPTSSARIRISDRDDTGVSAVSGALFAIMAQDTGAPKITLSALRIAGTVDDLSVATVTVGGTPYSLVDRRFQAPVTIGAPKTNIDISAADARGNRAARLLQVSP